MDGDNCPMHKTPMWLCSTTNEWRYFCKKCDKRYNEQLVAMPDCERGEHTWARRKDGYAFTRVCVNCGILDNLVNTDLGAYND